MEKLQLAQPSLVARLKQLVRGGSQPLEKH